MLKSKTVWVNLAFLFITAALSLDVVKADQDYTAVLLGLQSVVNIVLRFVTTKALWEK